MLGRGEFYITLDNSRYFFPGDTINGTVTLSLDKPTKTNCIRVVFKGDVEAGGDSFNLFTKQIKLATDAGILDARTHTYSFEFLVDTNLNLPSSTKLARGSISYGLTAVHERPLIPDALSSKAEYPLQILENINAEWPEFAHEAEMCQDVMISGFSKEKRKVRIIAKMPRFAFVRGDIIPVELSIKHFEPFTRTKAIKVELIRIALFGKSKNQTPVQHALRSLVTDLNVTTSNFVFSGTPNLMIPTATPPTIDINGKILNVQYQVRISINLNPSNLTTKSNNVVLEIPIVVATWPPAAIPIDLDLEDEEPEPEHEASEEAPSDPDDGEEEHKSGDVPTQVFIAPRPVRTSSLSHSNRPPPPIIPLSTLEFTAEGAAAASTLTSATLKEDKNAEKKVEDVYSNQLSTSISSDDTARRRPGRVGTLHISTNVSDGGKNSTTSPRFPTPTVSSIHENSPTPTSHGPARTMSVKRPVRKQSLSHRHHPGKPVPQTQPSSSMPMPIPTPHGQSSSSPGLRSAMPTPYSPSAFCRYQPMPMPNNPSTSHGHSTHYGHTPSISLPQMPIPNHYSSSECHYIPHHSPQKSLQYGYGHQTNNAFSMPEPVSYSQADQSTEHAYYPPQSQSALHYPDLRAESDSAYAPLSYPMSLPTPAQGMPSPNPPYQQSFPQYPF